jgi:glycosyltransferase involved in cell wall biosynthesis
MRVLMLVHSLRRGGAERVLLELSRALIQRGHDAMICSLLDVDEYPEAAWTAIPRRSLTAASAYRWPYCVPKLARRLAEVVKEFSPDVIEVHTPNVAWVAAYARVRRPVVHVLHGYDFLQGRGGLKRWVVRQIDRGAFRRLGRRVAVVSPGMVGDVAAHLGCDTWQITVLTNGIDLDRFAFQPRQPTSKPVVCMVGTLSRNKGQHRAIPALAALRRRLPGAQLWLIGEGGLRRELEHEIAARNLEKHVKLLGRQPGVPELLAQCHLLWHLSDSEGLPLVILEAMATGLPVVGFDVPGVREVVAHGETGFLVRHGDLEAVAEVSLRILGRADAYRSMCRTARARAEAEFELSRMVSAHTAVLLHAAETR